jgi:hypothetical protein
MTENKPESELQEGMSCFGLLEAMKPLLPEHLQNNACWLAEGSNHNSRG